MRVRILTSAAILLAAVSASPQQQGTIDHKPTACVVSNELPLMTVSTADDGLLRAYFRRSGTTDWCSVDGENHGKASSVVLPRFDAGTEIEYYFVVLRGRQVIAKSPQIYRVKATDKCEAPIARHSASLAMECLPPAQNPIATAMNAGYHAQNENPGKPPVQSPEKPERQ
jgi:hypothetical protein